MTKPILTSVIEQCLLRLGIALLAASQHPWQADVLGGLMCGLGAMGLYSGAKKVAGQ